jgi:hypothetical protein
MLSIPVHGPSCRTFVTLKASLVLLLSIDLLPLAPYEASDDFYQYPVEVSGYLRPRKVRQFKLASP